MPQVKFDKKNRTLYRKKYDGPKYSKGIRDSYFLYEKEKLDANKKFLPLDVYQKIVVMFFTLILKKLYKFGGRIYLPFDMGCFTVKSYKADISKSTQIDWQVYRETGKRVPYINGHTFGRVYRLKWLVSEASFYNRRFYLFKPRNTVPSRERGLGKGGMKDFIINNTNDPKKPTILKNETKI